MPVSIYSPPENILKFPLLYLFLLPKNVIADFDKTLKIEYPAKKGCY